MIQFILDNIGTIIVSAVVLLMVGLAGYKLIRDEKNGKTGCSGCSGSCSACQIPPTEE